MPSSITNIPPNNLPKIPLNYPKVQTPGTIELLLNSNSNYLYHKFSPYTNYHDSVLSGILSNRQPFVYTFIDEANDNIINQLPSTIQSLADLVNINSDSVNDVIRVSNFLVSTWGVQFLITQAAIQRLASFDETRIYNPLSPLLASVQPLTLGIGNRPTRHIEGGLLGLVNSVTSIVGINLQSGFQTPSSTVGDSALPSSNIGQGKGLIRGADASKGFAQVQMTWAISSTKSNGLGISSLFSSIKNAATQLFGTTNVSQPQGTMVRADENTYSLMASNYNKLQIKQQWYPKSSITIDKDNNSTSMSPLSSIQNQISNITNIITNPISSAVGVISNLLNPSQGIGKVKRTKLIALPNNKFMNKNIDSGLSGMSFVGRVSDGFGNNNLISNIQTGYSISDGDKYGKDVGRPSDEGDLTNSDMMVQYSYYVNDANNYSSKFYDPSTSDRLNKELQTIVNDINRSDVYSVSNSQTSYLLPYTANKKYVGYDNWTKKVNDSVAPKGTNPGVSSEYAYSNTSKVPTIDAFVSKNNNLRMATSFLSDGINTLDILGNERTIKNNTSYKGWKTWDPYKDDLIAFFFYDVVNEKYIPFRATVKTISESNTANWEDYRFVGRADQVYSYNGFIRTLSFSFNVVINSISELLPSWKKINYLASSVKPSNYTTGKFINQSFNRFIVPPMFMITIGDLYKFQPVVITTVNVNVPDDASWETLNENNSEEWNYLNGLITSPNVGKYYGQLPREVEIGITCNILEKERASVGGSHYGHEPRVDDWEGISNEVDRFVTGSANIPYLPFPTTLHQSFVEWNDAAKTTIEGQKRLEQLNNDVINISNKVGNGISNILSKPPTTTGIITAGAAYTIANTILGL